MTTTGTTDLDHTPSGHRYNCAAVQGDACDCGRGPAATPPVEPTAEQVEECARWPR